MPRKYMMFESQWQLVADTKQEIIDYMEKYVVPVYEELLKELREDTRNPIE